MGLRRECRPVCGGGIKCDLGLVQFEVKVNQEQNGEGPDKRG